DGLRSLVEGQSGRDLTRDVLPAFLAKQRWFAAKDAAISKVEIAAWAEFTTGRDSQLVTEVEVQFASGEPPQRYFMPLGISFDEQALSHGWPLLSFSLAQVRRGAKVGALYDGMAAEEVPLAVVGAMRAGRELPASIGIIRFSATSALETVDLPPDAEVRRAGVEQSNSSIMIGDQIVLKAYRRLAFGVQPELEIGRFLTEQAGFANTPSLLGAVERIEPDGRTTALGAAFGYIRNQGDGWLYTSEYLSREFEERRLTAATQDPQIALVDDDSHGFYLTRARVLGQRTAEMHRAFAIPTENKAFAAEPITARDLHAWDKAVRRQAEAAFAALRHAARRLEPGP
ncbi:MAG: maltokinase N-terminal cap-like domain-containing protein, partial [Geminicoccales bacterium]